MAKFVMLLLVVFVAGGLGYLALSDVPAPTKTIIKPLPMERFFK